MTDAAGPNRYQLAEMGALLAEPARAAMLLALIDGTASAHLKRLLEGGLLGVHVQGRHRYYRLDDDDVAAWLEAMALPRAGGVRSVPRVEPPLRRARTCYRHLAGQLGVAVCEAWLERNYLAADGGGLRLLGAGAQALAEAGLALPPSAKLLALRGRGCLDWTERRLHLGGPLGVAVTGAMLDAGWLRRAAQGRALRPSAEGLRRLALLGARLD